MIGVLFILKSSKNKTTPDIYGSLIIWKEESIWLASGFSSSLKVGNIMKIDFDVFFATV